MNLQLIEGEFKSGDALNLISQMIQVKIRFHESKIQTTEYQEDIKSREAKIKRLQNDLHDIRSTIASSSQGVRVNAVIEID